MNSKAWIIWRTCISKASMSKEEADTYVDRMASKGVVLYWYKCQFCQRYHMSKQESTELKLEVI